MAKKRTLIEKGAGFFLLIYLLILIYWMFFGFSRTQTAPLSYNIVPFDTIKNYFTYFHHYPFRIWVINIIGNIAVFIPFGILIPLWNKRYVNPILFLFMFVLGITILELLQISFRRGSFDVDDIILNTIGAFIGFIFIKLSNHKRANPHGPR